MITGPVSAKEAGLAITQSVIEKNGRVVAHKSENGEPPVLEIIMEMLYRNTPE